MTDLLHPIPGEETAGEDLSSSDALSDIDSALGRHGRDLQRACDLSEALLREKSKDLRIATRYALARSLRDGYEGLAFGLDLLYNLLEQYGCSVHPVGNWERRVSLLRKCGQELTRSFRSITILPQSPENNDYLDRSITTIDLIHQLISDDYTAEGELAPFGALADEIRRQQSRVQDLNFRNSVPRDDPAANNELPEVPEQPEFSPAEKTENTDTDAQSADFATPAFSSNETLAPTDSASVGDALAESKRLASAGKYAEAQKHIDTALLHAADGKSRYVLRVALAEICIEQGQANVASELLRRAIADVERCKIVDWEDREFWIPALIAFYGCPISAEERRSIFSRICEIAPLAAMDLSESSR